MNARQAHRRRQEAARAWQAAQRRHDRRRRLGIAAVLMVLLVAGIGGLAVSAASHDRRPAPAGWPACRPARRPGVPTPPAWSNACRPSACPH
jgi:hypothetical protein